VTETTIAYYRAKVNQLEYTITRIEKIVRSSATNEEAIYQLLEILNGNKVRIEEINEHASDKEYFK